MKRLPLLLLVALLAFALGAAAQKLNVCPLLPADLNAPCGKTVAEWKIMTGRIETESVPAGEAWDIFRLEGEVKPKGIVVRAFANPRAGAKQPEGYAGRIEQTVLKRLGLSQETNHVYILTYYGDRLSRISGNNITRTINPGASNEEVSAILAEIMAKGLTP